jgi:hypothetical protein
VPGSAAQRFGDGLVVLEIVELYRTAIFHLEGVSDLLRDPAARPTHREFHVKENHDAVSAGEELPRDVLPARSKLDDNPTLGRIQ